MTEAWHDFPAPGLITQFDGSAMQRENCAPSTWAGLIVAQQQGERPAKGSPWLPSGASLRAASGDRSGGIMPSLLDATTIRTYGIDLDIRIATLETVQSFASRRFAFGLLIGYRPIAIAGWSGSPGFYGAHSVGIYGTRVNHLGVVEWLVGDPLYNGRRPGIPKGMQWIPRSVVVRAGESLVVDSSGDTMLERFGHGHLYVVLTTRSYDPAVPPIPSPTIVTSAPATAAERSNPMLLGAYGVTSSKVQRLQPGQPLFASPGGARVTKLSGARPVSVSFLGKAGSKWGLVLVKTGAPYMDKAGRPTGLYVPLAAGPVSDR